ncbi:MAG: hypothetical protein AAFV88_20645, partial [Planctomycetota bacterium]
MFTVLVVSFVVFSSQMSESSLASNTRRQNEVLPKPPIEAAVKALLVGTNDPNSAAYGHSLLEDFYGIDGFELFVGHRRPAFSTTKQVPRNTADLTQNVAGARLLLPLAAGLPQTTLFKFPTNFVWWHDNGSDSEVSNPTFAATNQAERLLTPAYDDAMTGRIISFEEGPLANVPFRIVRSFGRDNGTNDEGASIANQWEYGLAGNFVIDLDELGDELIEINGISRRLYQVAATAPNLLTYDVGPDNAPGAAGIDDNGNSVTDDEGEVGWPGTDDVGFRFVLNGAVFNGRGVNPSGQSGLTVNFQNPSDTQTGESRILLQ